MSIAKVYPNWHRIAQEGVKFNVTIHRQIVDLLEDAGTDGMTLQVRKFR